jgi:hypothetical protein
MRNGVDAKHCRPPAVFHIAHTGMVGLLILPCGLAGIDITFGVRSSTTAPSAAASVVTCLCVSGHLTNRQPKA